MRIGVQSFEEAKWATGEEKAYHGHQLVRAGERPRNSRAAEQRHELAPPHTPRRRIGPSGNQPQEASVEEPRAKGDRGRDYPTNFQNCAHIFCGVSKFNSPPVRQGSLFPELAFGKCESRRPSRRGRAICSRRCVGDRCLDG